MEALKESPYDSKTLLNVAQVRIFPALYKKKAADLCLALRFTLNPKTLKTQVNLSNEHFIWNQKTLRYCISLNKLPEY